MVPLMMPIPCKSYLWQLRSSHRHTDSGKRRRWLKHRSSLAAHRQLTCCAPNLMFETCYRLFTRA
eukprot:4935456-Karenia_brevis.AAC.1